MLLVCVLPALWRPLHDHHALVELIGRGWPWPLENLFDVHVRHMMLEWEVWDILDLQGTRNRTHVPATSKIIAGWHLFRGLRPCTIGVQVPKYEVSMLYIGTHRKATYDGSYRSHADTTCGYFGPGPCRRLLRSRPRQRTQGKEDLSCSPCLGVSLQPKPQGSKQPKHPIYYGFGPNSVEV